MPAVMDPNRPARDIVVKLHYYPIKEKVMKTARELPELKVLDCPIQIYTDVAPAMIQEGTF